MVSLTTDGWTRLRYRRAELRRLPPASLSGEPGVDPPRWVSPDDGGENPAILQSGPGSRVSYHVTLPAGARLVTRCEVVGGPPASDRPNEVEFTVEAIVDDRQASGSCRVSPGGRGSHLYLHVTKGGAATIVLTTRLVAGAPAAGVQARWHNPRVEWRRPLRDLAGAVSSVVRRRSVTALGHRSPAISGERLYRLWVREQEPSKHTLRDQRGSAGTAVLTLITPVSGADRAHARRTLESLAAQTHPHWEWLVLTADPPTALGPGAGDARVRLIRVAGDRTPVAQLNQALAEARGECVAVIGPGDRLAPTALFEVARAVQASAAPDVVYTDEDRIDDRGHRSAPVFKPDWSPELLLACNYVGRLAMIRVAAARTAGGFREGFGEAHDWELLLRLSRAGARFQRLPACLYHRLASAPGIGAGDAALVLQDHGRSLGLEVAVTGTARASRMRWRPDGLPKVSVIIPNRDAYRVLRTCVDGLLDGTHYPNREVIIVDNGSTDPDVLALYARLEREGRGRIVPFQGPFNFSAACNAGAAAAAGEMLLFLNNDIEVVDPDWMEELVRWAQRPGIGVVGARLLYPDRMIQHAGVVFGLGLVGHIFARAPEGTDGVFGSTECYRNYLAVTGACQMMSRQVFERVGGFDERLRLSFSDVVLCMEAWKAGFRVMYTPYARLVHHESYTRQKMDSAEDMERFARYLRSTGFVEDPYLHPELDPKSLIPAVRPPFDPKPRQVIADFIDRVLAAAAVQPVP